MALPSAAQVASRMLPFITHVEFAPVERLFQTMSVRRSPFTSPVHITVSSRLPPMLADDTTRPFRISCCVTLPVDADRQSTSPNPSPLKSPVPTGASFVVPLAIASTDAARGPFMSQRLVALVVVFLQIKSVLPSSLASNRGSAATICQAPPVPKLVFTDDRPSPIAHIVFPPVVVLRQMRSSRLSAS